MTDQPTDRFTGLWVAVEAGVDEDPRVVTLAKTLKVRGPYVVGHLVLLWGGVAQHAPSGDLRAIPDEALEAWASWRGRPGRFAAAFKEQFVGADGQLRSWEKHNGRFLTHALKERERKRAERARTVPGTSTDSPRTVHGMSAVNPTRPDLTNNPGAGNGDGVGAGGVLDVPAIAKIAEALNAAMRVNPSIPDFKPVKVAGIAGEWLAAGIPLDLIIETVTRLGKDFKPTRKDPQISSLKYCDAAVRAAVPASIEARYQFLAGEARRGQDMGDTTKYPDWPEHEARFKAGGKAAHAVR